MYLPVCVVVMCSKNYTLVSPHLICEHCIKYFNNSVFPAGSVCKEEQKQHHSGTILFNVYSKDALISPLDYFLTTQSGGYKCNKYCVLNYHTTKLR